MGFRKCEFHKVSNDCGSDRDSMILDDVETKSVYQGGKRVVVERKKEHPKWDSFYKLDFTDTLKIWMYVEKQSIIKKIWIEGDRIKNGVELIYDSDRNSVKINGRRDIVLLFPQDVRRDFIINSLFD